MRVLIASVFGSQCAHPVVELFQVEIVPPCVYSAVGKFEDPHDRNIEPTSGQQESVAALREYHSAARLSKMVNHPVYLVKLRDKSGQGFSDRGDSDYRLQGNVVIDTVLGQKRQNPIKIPAPPTVDEAKDEITTGAQRGAHLPSVAPRTLGHHLHSQGYSLIYLTDDPTFQGRMHEYYIYVYDKWR